MNTDCSITSSAGFFSFPPEILVNICARLDIPSLLQFEITRKWNPELKKAVWLSKRKERDLAFDWSFLEQDEQKDKQTCLLNWALKRYVLEDRVKIIQASPTERLVLADKVNKREGAMMTGFPLVKAYLMRDLHFLQGAEQPAREELNVQKKILQQTASENKWGGDCLLLSLWKFDTLTLSQVTYANKDEINEKMQVIYSYCTQAVEKQATIASVLLFKCVKAFRKSCASEVQKIVAQCMKHNMAYIKGMSDLAVIAYEKGDYRGVEAFCSQLPLFTCFNDSLPMQSRDLTERLIKLQKEGEQPNLKWRWVNRGYQELLSTYGEQAPVPVIIEAILVKKHLKLWEEADLLYDKAIEMCDDPILGLPQVVDCEPSETLPKSKVDLFLAAIRLKQRLHLYKEVDGLYTKLLSFEKLSQKSRENIILKAARTKVVLESWAEANDLFTQLIDSRADIPPRYLCWAADMKCKLHLFKEADELYTRLWEVVETHSDVYTHMTHQWGCVKQQLGDQKMAETLFALNRSILSTRAWENTVDGLLKKSKQST